LSLCRPIPGVPTTASWRYPDTDIVPEHTLLMRRVAWLKADLLERLEASYLRIGDLHNAEKRAWARQRADVWGQRPKGRLTREQIESTLFLMGPDNDPGLLAPISTLQNLEDDVCGICHDDIRLPELNVVRLPCGHIYHEQCVLGWVVESKTCPHCRCVFNIVTYEEFLAVYREVMLTPDNRETLEINAAHQEAAKALAALYQEAS
jgi:hypothetical protein